MKLDQIGIWSEIKLEIIKEYASAYTKIMSNKEWCQPKIVSNALELLDKEIPKYRNKIKYVHLCFSTDPFMYKNKITYHIKQGTQRET